MNRAKQFATVSVIIIVLLIAIFFLMYQDYQYTIIREHRVIKSSEIAKEELNRAIYKALKRETQTKVDAVAKEIREETLRAYKGRMDLFENDYDNKRGSSLLMNVVDKSIYSTDNRFYYIESDSNNMFVAIDSGIFSNKSEKFSWEDNIRSFEDEILLHHNQHLARQAIDSMLSADTSDIFWKFDNSSGQPDIGLTRMDINLVLKLPLNELKDYEFLSVAYIDRYGDITGKDKVLPTGQKQNTRQMMVVQSFNLYEHIEENFVSGYTRIDKNAQLQLEVIEENRKGLVVRIFLVVAIIFISFFSMSMLQNSYARGRVTSEDKAG